MDINDIKETLCTGHKAQEVLREILLELSKEVCFNPSYTWYSLPVPCGECIICQSKKIMGEENV